MYWLAGHLFVSELRGAEALFVGSCVYTSAACLPEEKPSPRATGRISQIARYLNGIFELASSK
jgi:hypothetical protein